jgi:hypothetical protein
MASRLGRPPLAPKLRDRIQEALKAPGRPGVRKIAAQFGVNVSTVQQIAQKRTVDERGKKVTPRGIQILAGRF